MLRASATTVRVQSWILAVCARSNPERCSVQYAGDGTTAFEIHARRCRDSGADATAKGSAEHRSRLWQPNKPILVDLAADLEPDRLELAPGEPPAVEQKPDATGPVVFGAQEVDADEPGSNDLESALLAGLAPTGVPRRLPARVDLTTRDRPALLVVGFQDQQATLRVEDQRAGRSRDSRERILSLCDDVITHPPIIAHPTLAVFVGGWSADTDWDPGSPATRLSMASDAAAGAQSQRELPVSDDRDVRWDPQA